MPLDCALLNEPDISTDKITRLDFVVRREYQFLKNIFTEDEISKSEHLKSLDSYYNTMKYILNVYIIILYINCLCKICNMLILYFHIFHGCFEVLKSQYFKLLCMSPLLPICITTCTTVSS